MSWSVFLSPKTWFFSSMLGDLLSPETKTQENPGSRETSSYGLARRSCHFAHSKLPAYHQCLRDAKRRFQHPPAPPAKPKSELEAAKSRCNTLGKPAAIQACRRQAQGRVERSRRERQKAAENPAQTSPLERALQRCRSLGKSTAIFQCRRAAAKRYAPAPK